MIFGCSSYCKKLFLAFGVKKNLRIFGVKLTLHMSKKAKDFKNFFL
jgi:hypothetical protein